MFKKTIYTALLAGALTMSAGAAMAAGEVRPFDPARDSLNYATTAETITITGEVTSIQGLKFFVLGDNGGIMGVDIASMPYNPTNANEYEPAIEKGDIVSLRGEPSTLAENELTAREVLAVQKSWQSRPVFGQRLIQDDEELSTIQPAAGESRADLPKNY